MTKTVALLDYGSGNLRSAQRALERAGAEVIVSSDPEVCTNADGLLVPGVGAFDACMKGLKTSSDIALSDSVLLVDVQ